MGKVNVTEERTELTVVDKGSDTIKKLQGEYKALGSSIDAVKGTLIGLGATLGVGAMASFYRDVLNSNAELYKMSQSAGASVENLSKLKGVAKIGGHDFEGLTDQVGRMIKGLKGADEEGQNAAYALKFLQVEAKDANGRFRDTGDILLEVAKALNKYEDGGNKVALVQDILGKGAARYLPFLKDLAEATNAHAKITGEQAKQAEEAEKNIRRLEKAFGDTKRQLVLETTPALSSFIERLLEAKRVAGGWGAGLYAMTDGLGMDVGKRLQELDKEIAHRQRPATGPRIFANLPLIGMNGSVEGIQVSQLIHEREYLKFVQRQQALEGAGDGNLDARDLMARGKSALGYQSPAKVRERMALSPYESRLLEMRQQTVKEEVGPSEFVETQLAIRAGKYNTYDDATGKVRELTRAEKTLLLQEAANRDAARNLREERDAMSKSVVDAQQAADEYTKKLVAQSQAFKDLLDPGRLYIHEQAEINELVRTGNLTQEEGYQVQRKLLENRTKVADLAQEVNLAAEAGKSLGLSFASAFDQIALGSGRSITALGLLRASAMDVAKVMWGRSITQPLATAGGDFLTKLFSGGAYQSGTHTANNVGYLPWGDAPLQQAKGGAFYSGRAIPFASGGVVTSPSFFPMAGGRVGLMGEAGAEAIMPLRRTSSGRLGVEASSNDGVSITFNHTVHIDSRTDQMTILAAVNMAAEKAKVQLVDMMRRGVRP